MIKYVIFDFDGTLVDSKDVFISSWNTLAEKRKYRMIKTRDIELLKKMSMKERIKYMQFPIYKIPFVVPHMYQLYRESIQNISLFQGIKNILDEIERNGVKTAIISSNAEENITYFLKKHDVKISNVLCSSKIFCKDKLIKRFLKKNSLHESEVIYVGDEQRDVIACKKSGVKMIWVGWGYDTYQTVKKEKPDYMVYTPHELLKVIQEEYRDSKCLKKEN
ncbi:HAD-IA family hydrolase [Evansella sp. AB-rgal1]|uniref:HAD-IA family hydrolase n=1 Tax=Evansella sp. AB-rgal1 TaxID=3242696 RepID=UPI00359DC396